MKGIRILLKYPLPLLFAVLLALPFVNGYFGVWEYERRDENRAFTDSIHVEISNLDVLPKECNAYINDNFSFRTPLLNLYHEVKFRIFKVSPHPDKAIIGSNNWFYRVKNGKDIYEGKRNFTDTQLDNFMTEWTYREHYLDSMDIKFYWVIGPIKYYIYPEHLPFTIRRGEVKRVDQLKEFLSHRFPDLIVDPTEALLAAKEEHKVYYQLDNHWSYYGGYVTAKLLLSRIKDDFPQRNIPDLLEYTWSTPTIQKGIHYNVLGIKELSELDIQADNSINKAEEIDLYGFVPPERFMYPKIYEKRYLNKECRNGLRVLFIRDSFGTHLIQFINESIYEADYVFDNWQYALDKSIIETMKPDVVVFLGLETHMENMIDEY